MISRCDITDDTVVIYPLWVQFDVLHRFRLRKQHHLLDDVHLIVGIDGLMEFPVVYTVEMTEATNDNKAHTNACSVSAVKCVLPVPMNSTSYARSMPWILCTAICV